MAQAALNRLCALFPEYHNEIKVIFDCYLPYTHEKCYQICSNAIKYAQSTMGLADREKVMDRSRPAVSIGMPVYNGEIFIREALDSLLAQTFANFELIISDNTSTDATESICRNYAEQDSRVRYIRQQENRGALPNFQFVLNEARGEYFMWAACDDKWDRNWITLLCNRLEVTESCAAFGRLLQIDEHSQPIEHPATHNSFQFTGSYLKRRASFFVEFEGKGKANLFYSLFRISTIAGIELTKYNSDYLALFDLLSRVKFVSVSNTFLYKRIHATSAGTVKSKTIIKRLLDIITLKLLWRGFCVAKSYLNYAKGSEWLALAILIPVKIFNNHLFYVWRVLSKLIRSNLAR
jgi:glycosyltransferase involved in cell wall biosynthesis